MYNYKSKNLDEIDKVKILVYVKKELIHLKAFAMSLIKTGIANYDPIYSIKNIEVYELLLEYLENDKTIQNKALQLKK